MNPYYVIDSGGQQIGPFTHPQLQTMVNAGHFSRENLCWREGLTEWQAISSVIPSMAPPLPAPAAVEVNRYLPTNIHGGRKEAFTRTEPYGGIGRAAYFGYSVLLQVVFVAAAHFCAKYNLLKQIPLGEIALIAVMALAAFFLTAMRLKNTGNSLWLLLLLLVPGLNALFVLALGLYAVIVPEGYADTRKLDGPGKTLAWLFGLLFVAFVLFIVVSAMVG